RKLFRNPWHETRRNLPSLSDLRNRQRLHLRSLQTHSLTARLSLYRSWNQARHLDHPQLPSRHYKEGPRNVTQSPQQLLHDHTHTTRLRTPEQRHLGLRRRNIIHPLEPTDLPSRLRLSRRNNSRTENTPLQDDMDQGNTHAHDCTRRTDPSPLIGNIPARTLRPVHQLPMEPRLRPDDPAHRMRIWRR